MKTILTINPGSTSTKIGLFSSSERLWEKNIPCSPAMKHSDNVADEFEERLQAIYDIIPETELESLDAVVGRCGPLKPMTGGVFNINNQMLGELRSARYANHASNLGALLADAIAKPLNIPAYIVDPVTVDEFEAVSRISGVPAIARKSRSHALNIKATVRKACDENNWNIDKSRFVVAHLGGGISIAAIVNGRIIDVNDGQLGMGPFSPERAGALPLSGMIDLAFSGKYTKDELKRVLTKESGLKAYLGTNDGREIEKRIDQGDEEAKLIYDAMIYQILKEIGAMIAVCHFSPVAVLMTGGLAHSPYIRHKLSQNLDAFKVLWFPGENELEAMADGGFRALRNEIEIQEYK